MAELLAQYTFLSWVRRGIATALAPSKKDPARAGVELSATFDSSVPAVGSVQSTLTLDFYGPADIAGIDSRAITRVWPLPGMRNAEPNYFPLIEFNQPDLPWRYSPQRGDSNRVKPWLCLVVLKTSEVNFEAPAPNRPLGILTVPVAALPDLSQSWAWAHTQFNGHQDVSGPNLPGALASMSNQFLARILSSFQMLPETNYTAFLVPAFRRGRLAGLGRPPEGGALDPAWPDGANTTVNLPVYYQWSFHAGPAGDFESLAKKIHPHPLPETTGFRLIDVSKPGFGLNGGKTPLGVEGALQKANVKTPLWPPGDQSSFVAGLVKILNLPFELLRPPKKTLAVSPPLYGRWPAAQDQITASSPPWFQQLNEDPRLRVAAGAGTQVVQNDQQGLLAAAWAQVGAVRAANQKLMQMQWGRLTTTKLYESSLKVASDEALIMRTAPLHRLVLGSPQTIRKLIEDSPISAGVLEPQYRRLSRPTGPLGRRQGRASAPQTLSILDRMNRGQFSPAPPPPTPSGLPTPATAGKGLLPGWATPRVRDLLRRAPPWLLLLGILLLLIMLPLLAVATGVGLAVAIAVAVLGAASAIASPLVRNLSRNLDFLAGLTGGTLSGQQIRDMPPSSSFVPFEIAPGSATRVPVTTAAGTTGSENVAAANFRTAAAKLFDRLSVPPAELPPLQAVRLSAFRGKIAAALDPSVTFAETMKSRLSLAPGLFQLGGDPLGRIMAAPEFEKPMYEPLRDLSQEWILPGIANLHPDSVAGVVTNEKFIEAYMVGVNHEMARTLLFNDYPTEQRATFFRQFWNSKGYVPKPGETVNPDEFKDIKPVHTWPRSANLGDNSSRRPPAQHLVLLVRGELLLRYPRTEVYAAEVVLENGKHALPAGTDTAKHKPHVFHGELDPDIRFFGFELTVDEAKTGGLAKLGYYFVLQQPSGEPLFGFEAKAAPQVNSFKELAWTQVVANPAQLQTLRYLDFTSASETVQQLTTKLGLSGPVLSVDAGLTAANLAKSSFRIPVRVAFHAKVIL